MGKKQRKSTNRDDQGSIRDDGRTPEQRGEKKEVMEKKVIQETTNTSRALHTLGM